MEKKEAIVILWQNGDEKIADIYDTNADVSAALNTLIDGFEYPDHSHKTIQTVLLSYFLKNGSEYRKEMDLGKTLCHHALAHHANEKNIDLMPYFTTMQIAIGASSLTTTKFQTLSLFNQRGPAFEQIQVR